MNTKNSPDTNQFPTKSGMLRFFLKGSFRYFVLSVIFSMIVSLLDMINPKLIGFTVDSVIGDQPSSLSETAGRFIDTLPGGIAFLREHFVVMALIVAGLAVIAAVFRYLSRWINALGAETLLERMRNSLFVHISKLPFSWLNENQTGDIIQRCTTDVDSVKNFVSEHLTTLFRVCILIASALFFMSGINLTLTLATAAFIPVVVLYSFIFHTKIWPVYEKVDIADGKLSTIAQENLTGVRVVRAFGREQYERRRFEEQNEVYTTIWIRIIKVLSLFWSTGDCISGLQTMTAVTLGSYLCVHGRISAGDMIAFITYNTMLIWPVRSLGRVISEMAKVGVSIERLRVVMNAAVEDHFEGSVSENVYAGDVCFDHVSFRYGSGSKKTILDDVTFSAKAGTTIGILGGTGSGKSTLSYVLDRLYDLPEDGGRITIGGVNLKNLPRGDVRRHIGLVLQEPFLFSKTIFDNISIAKNDATPEDVKAAAAIASLDETIEHFTAGYETYVGERGVTLSGGQKQRTAIAQMLIRKPPIMIFDDSLSAVDAETDAKIRHALRDQLKDATVFLISHRITTLMQADQIIVLDHGRIAERGSHEELLAHDGFYRKIYDLQLAQSEELNEGGGLS